MVALGELHVVLDVPAGMPESDAVDLSTAVLKALSEWASRPSADFLLAGDRFEFTLRRESATLSPESPMRG